ncbi:MAG: hypothetical protein LBD23_09730, partial [Oscillospiraceae bacterium]|nr:hypothetical protein [Oscillospiraceae bacterium]
MMHVYWHTIKDSFKASPKFFLLNVINNVLRAISAIGLILLLQWLFEAVEEFIGVDVDTKRIFVLIGIFAITTILNEVFDSLSNLLPNYLSSHTDR